MTKKERVEKLKHFITCLKCEVSGKSCDVNCSTQYGAGNMGEIIENLEEIAKVLEQEPCDDAVRRTEVIDELNRLGRNAFKDDTDYDNFFAFVDSLPSVTPQEPRWIPVTERLPEEHICDDGYVEPSSSVLVQLNNKEMKVSRYWGSRESYKDKPWIDLSYPTTLEVVAWMPLPKPYEESEGV